VDPDQVGLIDIILENSVPNRHPRACQSGSISKLSHTFSRKLKFTVQNTENYDTYDIDER